MKFELILIDTTLQRVQRVNGIRLLNPPKIRHINLNLTSNSAEIHFSW